MSVNVIWNSKTCWERLSKVIVKWKFWVKILNFPNFIRFFCLRRHFNQQCFNEFLVPKQKTCICRYTAVADIQREWHFINMWLKLRVLSSCIFGASYNFQIFWRDSVPRAKKLKLTFFRPKSSLKYPFLVSL